MNKRFLAGTLALLLCGGAALGWLHRYSESAYSVPSLAEEVRRGTWQRKDEVPVAVTAGPLDLKQPVRLAIGSLGLPEEEANRQLGALITAELSPAPGWELIERQELDKVLREAQLSFSGLVRAAAAVKVGKLLKADWFLLGNGVRLSGTNLVVARIVDARSGVIQNLTLLGENQQPGRMAKALADFTRRVRQTAAQPKVQEFLALGHFADVGVNRRQAGFPSRLRSYLMSAYQGC